MQNTFNMNRFVKEFNQNRVRYDKRFQRRVVWTSKHKNAFLESLSRGWSLQPIITLDIRACQDYCASVGDFSSKRQFAEL